MTHTAEDIFQRLILKDDPDAADIYRRLIQRGGGDGERECAEAEASPWPALVPVTFEQMMLDLGAFLNSDDFSGDLADVTYNHGVTTCLLMRGRCWTHPLDDPGFDAWFKRYGVDHPLSIAVRVISISKAWTPCASIDPMLYYRSLAWCCTVQDKSDIKMNVNMDPVRRQLDALTLAARQAAARTRSLNHAYTPQHSAGPHRTSGPSRKRPTLTTAPRR